MEKDRLSRKLAVILHADVVGSTKLVQQDEVVAHERIQSTFQRFSETIKAYGGITRELRGDALVAEFERASDAVIAAIAFQAQNEEFDADLSDEIKPTLRIGISLGEVVIADNTITGAGVVLAQRLEQLANAGGVVVQGSVSETVPARMPFEFESLGNQEVKGFDQPVRAFVARLRKGEELPAPDADVTQQTVATEYLQVPDEPSIAVLPFTNMSNDPEQEFFSDGISEDIITALSKVSALMVIARNSTFVYKGKAVDIKQVGLDQGVRYVLEGSVRKSGNRVRIVAQLIDAITGLHVWAERYDRGLEDIFALQDEITQKIVSALDVHLLVGEQARFWTSSTENLEAWEYFRLARDLMDGYRAEDLPEVIRLAQKAIDLDPKYAAAWSLLAGCHFHIEEDARYSEKDRKQALKSTRDCIERALECDPSCATAYSLLGLYHLTLKQYDEAIHNVEISVKMAPNYANNIALSALILNKCGQPERALDRIRKAMRLCPMLPLWFLSVSGQVSRVLGNYDESVNSYTKWTSSEPDTLEGHIGLTEVLSQTGRIEEAMKSAAEIIRINPEFTIGEYISNLAYRDPAETARFEKNLREAGLPE